MALNYSVKTAGISVGRCLMQRRKSREPLKQWASPKYSPDVFSNLLLLL
jgi:hypothetical protein